MPSSCQCVKQIYINIKYFRNELATVLLHHDEFLILTSVIQDSYQLFYKISLIRNLQTINFFKRFNVNMIIEINKTQNKDLDI